MRFDIMTLFPEMVMNGLETSIIGRAVKNKILEIEAWNIRDYAFNKHSSVDDYPYGGGAGMLMQAEPVYQTYLAIQEKATLPEGKRPRVIYLSPQGKPFNQKMAEDFAKEDELVLLCGHYEGIDELPAMMIVDAVSRLIPGVLHNDVSAEFESFQDNLLEYPQYSRPEIWHDRQVPPILLSGHHANVEKWRREQSVIRTAKWRPDLLEDAELTMKERELAEEIIENREKDLKNEE